jgi:hypothetical protein
MADNAISPNDVLQSDHHSKLSAEEIAKALARHNRHHSGIPSASAPAKSKQAGKH